MKLQEIFDHLAAGEFSQLNLYGQGAGVINDNNIDRVISHVSLGLTDLYSRFSLKLGTLVLQLQDGQTRYWLNSKYAVQGKGNFTPKYILDSPTTPFKNDVLLVLGLKGDKVTHRDIDLPLNDGHMHACTTPTMDTLDIPLAWQKCTQTVSVTYRANHLVLDPNTMSIDPDSMEIELPRSHLTALLYFMASRANNPVGLGQEFNAGNTFAMKYEKECQRLKLDGYEAVIHEPESKFYARGFV